MHAMSSWPQVQGRGEGTMPASYVPGYYWPIYMQELLIHGNRRRNLFRVSGQAPTAVVRAWVFHANLCAVLAVQTGVHARGGAGQLLQERLNLDGALRGGMREVWCSVEDCLAEEAHHGIDHVTP